VGARNASCHARSRAATPSPARSKLYSCCCGNDAAKELPSSAGGAAVTGLFTAPVPANLAQWTATATLFRDMACLPFGCLDLNVSS
jgi:hypothetical protein